MNLLQKFILSPGNIQIVSLDTQAKLSILRDDRLAFGMGTKFRKFLGIHSKLQVQNVKKVVLQGELHSNALAAFCFLFYNFGYQIRSIAYTRDPKRVTANSIFVKWNSHELEIVSSRDEWKKKIQILSEFLPGLQDVFSKTDIKKDIIFRPILIPEYGMSLNAAEGLNSLWSQIQISEYDRLVVDLGSGLTFLSAKKYFGNSIPIYGVNIGFPKKKMLDWLEQKKSLLGFSEVKIEVEKILEISNLGGFGSKNGIILEYCNSFYRKNKIPLEPIYSGKSLYVIESLIQGDQWKGHTLYLHQGGLWNFLDHFMNI
ncbi:1-aminocyclopropane-1-carboxylate deaminase [Leptospira interrogans]|uniref:1-aminocyclopropane-1-carboxylate deaminase n=1 Tax=Leptospira interrogans TaxID=173 RepID=UPI001F07428F|nr:1-aminocyclopropane-1-carboxylate deaminase [Leptospira interrogans]UML83444.1 1-aminocyclopropane-1-carboxylate deaminase [Leptospira interrogans]